MDSPGIQYAKTNDGVSIAYWTLGSGPPLVHSWGVTSHSQLEWQFPEIREWYLRLARSWRLISYEKRGVGLSQREVDDFSLDAHVLDLEAVVTQLDLGPFTLFAPMSAGMVGVAYAAAHPDSDIRLILWNSWRRQADLARAASVQAMETLLQQDWLTYSETYAHLLLGWDQGEPAHRYAAMLRESTTQETEQRRQQALRNWDITPLLPSVKAETLVLQRSGLAWLDLAVGRELATTIPGARFVIQDGESVPPFLGDMQGVARAIESFVGAATASERPPPGLSASGGGLALSDAALRLSRRQQEILRLMVSGQTNREIAAQLVLSLRTVERHANDIYSRLGVRNRTEAVAYALRRLD
jgi:DNA-binding CsgD family transcriptional regulator/pimeloyl-ACP methyl ester carboxylesterase